MEPVYPCGSKCVPRPSWVKWSYVPLLQFTSMRKPSFPFASMGFLYPQNALQGIKTVHLVILQSVSAFSTMRGFKEPSKGYQGEVPVNFEVLNRLKLWISLFIVFCIHDNGSLANTETSLILVFWTKLKCSNIIFLTLWLFWLLQHYEMENTTYVAYKGAYSLQSSKILKKVWALVEIPRRFIEQKLTFKKANPSIETQF